MAEPQKRINHTTIRLVRDDVTLFPAEAMVHYARPDLSLGTGYGNAIAVRGGPSIQEEATKLAPVEVGKAVATKAGELPAKYVIHAVGPRFQEPDAEGKLRQTALAALQVAKGLGVKSIAFPPMGAGFYGVPLEVSAKATLGAIAECATQGKTPLEEVIVCFRDPRELKPFQAALEKLQ